MQSCMHVHTVGHASRFVRHPPPPAALSLSSPSSRRRLLLSTTEPPHGPPPRRAGNLAPLTGPWAGQDKCILLELPSSDRSALIPVLLANLCDFHFMILLDLRFYMWTRKYEKPSGRMANATMTSGTPFALYPFVGLQQGPSSGGRPLGEPHQG